MILTISIMSCKEVDLTFDQDNAFIAFQDPSGSLSENAAEAFIFEVYYASYTTGDVSVTLELDATGIDNPAVEGVDFNVISGKSLNFNSSLVQVVEIEAIDNDERAYIRSINIVLKGDGDVPLGMAGGASVSYTLTIVDDEHPLARWIGNYDVAADSYGDVLNDEAEGAWNEDWSVTISQVTDHETKLSVVGIGFGSLPVTVSVDLEAKTITLPAGADVGGDGYGFDDARIWRGDYENVEKANVVGTIHEDGSITVDLLTMIVTILTLVTAAGVVLKISSRAVLVAAIPRIPTVIIRTPVTGPETASIITSHPASCVGRTPATVTFRNSATAQELVREILSNRQAMPAEINQTQIAIILTAVMP